MLAYQSGDTLQGWHIRVLVYYIYEFTTYIVRLVLQPPICGISCRQILEIRRLLEILSLF